MKRDPADILRDCLVGKCDREIRVLAHQAGLPADRLFQFVDEPTVDLTAEEKQALGAVTLVGRYFEKADA
jgi:uncharacterized protein YcbX